jgi:tRNA A-37 threonylcarbamoyl transferase component Bud32
LDCLTDKLLARCAAGELSDDALALVEEHIDGCATCRRLVGDVLRAEHQSAPTTPAAPSTESQGDARDAGAAPVHARYELEGEIGRGGLGRIRAARDRRLRRTVAVKELLDRDPAARERFEREAYITARLQHPAIVPLYDLDAWDGGEPFYAMKLVSGSTLERLIAAANTLDERLALLPNMLATCEAMAYAHGERIIHRDLKPANVLVGSFGETVVIDWGLAKDLRGGADEAALVDAAGAGSTLAGTVLGTPSYMPPEQARGEAVDERADVYALGAMLYHLFAGTPPYREPTAQATLSAVAAGPPPPLGARQPGIARDLLTIVGKAMARYPGARYATAKELAADVRRFTTGQLVKSHVYSWSAMVRRFVRKNRAAVLVAALMLGVIAVGAAIAVRQVVRERNVAEQQRGAAEELVRYSLSELRERLEGVGRLDVLGSVGAEVERYYRALLAIDPRLDEATAAQRSGAVELLAGVRWDQGDVDGALALCQADVGLRRRQARLRPDGTDWADGLLTCQERMGKALRMRGRLSEAHAALAEGLALAGRLATAHGDDPAWRSWQGVFHRAIGVVDEEAQDFVAALASYRAGLAAALEVAARDPRSWRWQRELETSYAMVADELRREGDLPAALDAARAALEGAERLAASDPGNRAWQHEVAKRQQTLCLVDYRLGAVPSALAACTGTRNLLARLVAADPGNSTWLQALADAHDSLGNVQELAGDLEAALASFRAGLDALGRLPSTDRTNLWLSELATEGLPHRPPPNGRRRRAATTHWCWSSHARAAASARRAPPTSRASRLALSRPPISASVARASPAASPSRTHTVRSTSRTLRKS